MIAYDGAAERTAMIADDRAPSARRHHRHAALRHTVRAAMISDGDGSNRYAIIRATDRHAIVRAVRTVPAMVMVMMVVVMIATAAAPNT